MSKETSYFKVAGRGPSQCEHRDRAEDAAESAREMAQLMKGMDIEVAWKMVRAREAATNIHEAFPEGDQRFIYADVDDDDDDENGTDPRVTERIDASGDSNGGAGDDLDGDIDDEKFCDDEREDCIGLLDDGVDAGPLSSLRRMKDTYDFDLVAEFDKADVDLLERIRVVNWIRQEIREQNLSPQDAMVLLIRVLSRRDKTVLENDAYLEPVIPGDVLLTVLEGGNGEDVGETGEKDYDREEENRVREAVIKSLQSEGLLQSDGC